MDKTSLTAPTEEEIRSAIARQWGARPPFGDSINVKYSDGVGACLLLLDGLYEVNDLRQSEDHRLCALLEEAVDTIRDDARRRINEAMVAAALTFAAEHPDAPRTKIRTA